MRNILSCISPIYGKEIKTWIEYHTSNTTEYTRIARRMHRFLNISDKELYVVHTSTSDTACGKIRRGYPIVVRYDCTKN